MAWDKEFWDKAFKGGRDYSLVNRVYVDHLYPKLVEKLSREPRTALDVACGTGQLAQLLAERGVAVTARDISTIALEKAADRLEDHPDAASLIEFSEGNFDTLNPEQVTERYDLIFIKLSYTFVQDKSQFLRWARAALADRGVFVLMTPVLTDGYDHDDFEQMISVARAETEELLHEVFPDVEIFFESYAGETGMQVDYLLGE